MRSGKNTIFKYVDRGRGRAIALIPGWATDSRIFGTLDLPYDYILPVEFSPFGFQEALADAVSKQGIAKLSLFGWSLGGFVAQEFRRKYAELVDEIILVSMRKKYEGEEIERIKKYIERGREGYLRSFYSQCFHRKENLSYFKKGLLTSYIKKFDTEDLLETLDYLGNSEIMPAWYRDAKVRIIHGIEDRIAPFAGALEIWRTMGTADFIPVENAGHMLFLETELGKLIG